MRKIKLCLFTTDSKIGGTEKMILSLAKGLDKEKYEVTVCTLLGRGPLIEEAKKSGVRAVSLNMKGKWDISVIPRFFSFLRKHRIDILHTYLYHANILGRILGRLAGVPIIISSQRTTEFYGQKKSDRWRRGYRIFLDKWTSRFCCLIISNSEAGRRFLIEEGIDPAKIITIHNGVDLDQFTVRIAPGEKKRRYGLRQDSMLVGIIANLTEVKGHKYFLQAAREVLKSIPQAEFLIVGDGPLREDLGGLSKNLGISAGVNFMGFRQDIPEILSILNVFVLSSLWEGFPVSILEAMAAGKPVIASKVGGIPEAVIDEKTGILVPPEDEKALAGAIEFLLNKGKIASEMGMAGRRRAEEHFSLQRMTGEIEAAYEKFL